MFCEVVINMFYYNTCSRMWPMFPMDDSHDYNVPNHVSIHITNGIGIINCGTNSTKTFFLNLKKTPNWVKMHVNWQGLPTCLLGPKENVHGDLYMKACM